MHHQALCALIESLLNAARKRSLTEKLQLATLDEKTLSVHVDELNIPICFNFIQDKIFVTSHLSTAADCRIHIQLKSLPQLKNTDNLTTLIKQEKLDLEGDLKVAQGFLSLLESIDIDWRSALAEYIGDVATFKFEQLFETLRDKLAFTRSQVKQDAREWLLYEKRWLVSAGELHQHSTAVDQCQHHTEQLAQRIDVLYKKTLGNNQP